MVPRSITMVRMVMQVSIVPEKPKYPIAPPYTPRRTGSTPSMFPSRRLLGGPGGRAGRKGRAKGVKAIEPVTQGAAHVRYEMHDVGVAFDHQTVGDRDTAHPRDTSDIVASQIDQHDVLGNLLGIGLELLLEL